MDEATRAASGDLPSMGRMGEPQEVDDRAAFLCSEVALSMTGGYYLVDGEYTAQ